MKCLRCQAESPEGPRFCEDCGARLETTCSACGQPVGADKKFCRSSIQPTRFDSPECYTPRYLAERIMTSKSALEGERERVTVLFADLKGPMGAARGPRP
jgi:predicted amidophosphoribosyltransferase